MTFECITSLEENPVNIYLEVSSILIKLIDNVLHYPSNPKYRKLRLENKLVSSVIMPAIGAMECLFELGFQEGDDALLLPPENTSIERLTRFRDEISKNRTKYRNKNEGPSQETLSQTQQNNRTDDVSTTQAEASASVNTPTSPKSDNQFLVKVHNMSLMVLQYEDESNKRKALSVVPLNEITEKVQKHMRQHQQSALKDNQPLDETGLQEALFLTELMNWFKNDFFEWVNAPECPECKCESKFVGMSSDPKELLEEDRVEIYQCGECSARILFPRINDVAKLLDTRRGRCGEWANAFSALCRALGWDTRYIWDVSDHVWTEVYSKSECRWIHCDACECALDKPLLYEKGWGKQLSYVIGFSCEGVQDVTWRYSADHKAVLSRRNLCSEQQLAQTISHLNQIRQANVTPTRKKALARKTVVELIELMVPPKETEGSDQGRQSGSLAWRLARHETTLTQAENISYVWTPTQLEVESKKMVISYSTGRDQYLRLGGEMAKGWRSRTFSVVNMFRKEEKDWKTVYLCRTMGSEEGSISWQVDVSSVGLVIEQVEVQCPSTVFHSGKIRWLLCSGDKCLQINNGELKTSELKGSSSVKLSASLSGGEGNDAWQHAQLFRQPLDSSTVTFQLHITLNDS